MKRNFLATIAALLAMVACMGVLAGCSNPSDTTGTTAPNNPTTETTVPATPQEDVIGKITAVSDSFVNLTVYTATGDITNYVALDVSALSATEDTDYAYTASTAKYYKVVNGAKSDATRADLQVDDIIAVTTDTEGVQHIYIYSANQNDTTGSNEPTTGETA